MRDDLVALGLQRMEALRVLSSVTVWTQALGFSGCALEHIWSEASLNLRAHHFVIAVGVTHDAAIDDAACNRPRLDAVSLA